LKIEKWDEINGVEDNSDKLQVFLDSTTDTYAILQLRRCDETALERFAPYWQLEHMDITPNIDHYETVYVDTLPPFTDRTDLLEGLFQKFNVDRPDDFTGHSLSVSDIVAIKAGSVVSCHYVDSIGFKELPNFIKPENYLKNAEMAIEDDYNSIDGIVNNGRKEEPEQKSVLEQLREKPMPERPALERPRKREELSL